MIPHQAPASEPRKDSIDHTLDLLDRVRFKGVRLWVQGERLHFMAPMGAISSQDMALLSDLKEQIVAFLSRAPGVQLVEPAAVDCAVADRVPVTFTQLAHWNTYQLGHRQSLCLVASATRISGRLDVELLQKSFAEVIRRHDALLTGMDICDGAPEQEIRRSAQRASMLEDLDALERGTGDIDLRRYIQEKILTPVDVVKDPLLKVRLLRVHREEYILVVAMEHLISDAVSLSNSLRELFTAYAQLQRGVAVSLPPVPLQSSAFAAWQSVAHKEWMNNHWEYWDARLSGCRRLRFPTDSDRRDAASHGWGTVQIRIDSRLKGELLEWCRQKRTTFVLSIFTAFVALVMRWCNVSDTVILYETDGRISERMASAVGYFAFPLYLRIQISESDTFSDLLRKVQLEYCTAYEHADSSYMQAQLPRPDFTRNTCFNCVAHDANSVGSELDARYIECSDVQFEHPILNSLELDIEPFGVLRDRGQTMEGAVQFPRDRYGQDTMARFGREFLRFIQLMISDSQHRLNSLPSG